MMDFRDRHVVVTGGTGALGSAVSLALLQAGAVCHIPYRSAQEAERFAQRGHRNVKLYPGVELADEASVEGLYAKLDRLWASIHIAGGFAVGDVAETGKAALMHQIDTNLVSTFLCCRAAVNLMRRGQQGGRIVNVAARPGLEWRAGAGMSAYAASKAAVVALTVALAEEVARDGILANAIAPSIIDTPVNRADMPKADFANWPKPDEIAATILHLASPENRVTLGAIVPVYGLA